MDSSDRNRLSVTLVDVAEGKEADFVALAMNFGQNVANLPPISGSPELGSLVPEPSVFALVALCGIACSRRQRRRTSRGMG